MTNFEKYKKEVLDIATRNVSPIAVCEGRPRACGESVCSECELYAINGNCVAKFLRWLYKEYQEKPKLSEKAYYLLKSFPDDAEIIITAGFLYVIIGGVMDSMDYCNFLPEFPKEVEYGKRYKVSDLLGFEVEE